MTAESPSRRPRPDVRTADPRHVQLPQMEFHRRGMHAAVGRVLDAWPKAAEDAQAVGFPAGRGFDGVGGGRSGFTVETESGDREFVPATGVELAALNPTVAVAWISELHDVVTALIAAAWPARAWSLVWTPSGLSETLHAAVDRLCGEWRLDDLTDLDPRSPNYGSDVFGLQRLADKAAAWWPPPPRSGDRVGGVTIGARSNEVETCGLCGDPVAGGRNDPIRRIDGQAFHGKRCWFTVTRQRQGRPPEAGDGGESAREEAS